MLGVKYTLVSLQQYLQGRCCYDSPFIDEDTQKYLPNDTQLMELEIIFVCSETHVSCPQLSGAGPLPSIACVAQTHTWAPRCVPGRGAPWPHHVHGHTSPPQTVSPTCSGIPYKHQLLEQDPFAWKAEQAKVLGACWEPKPGKLFP